MKSVPTADAAARPAATTATPAAQPEIPVVDVRKLLGEGREVVLMHLGEPYRLRITARERLILTK